MLERSDCLGVLHLGWSSQQDPKVYRSNLQEYSYLEWILRRATGYFAEVAVLVPEDARFDYVYDQSIQWTNYVYRERERTVGYERILDHFERFDRFAFLSGVSPFFSKKLIRDNLAEFEDRDWMGFRGLPDGTDLILANRNCLKFLQSGGPSEFSIDSLKTFMTDSDTCRGEVLPVENGISAPNYDLSPYDREHLDALRSIVESLQGYPEEIDVQVILAHIDDLPLDQRRQSPLITDQSGNVIFALNVGGKAGLNAYYEFISVLEETNSTDDSVQIIGLIGSGEIDNLTYRDLEGRTATNLEMNNVVIMDNRVSVDDIFRWVSRLGASSIVLNQSGLRADEVKKLSGTGCDVIGINESEPVWGHLDAVFDPLECDDRNGVRGPDSGKYFGPDFAIVHPECREISRTARSNPIEDVGLFFSFEDESRSEISFLKQVAPQFPEFTFHLSGGVYRDIVPEDIPINVKIAARFDPSPNLREYDFIISAVGAFMLESIATNTPAMVYTKTTDEFKKCEYFFEKYQIQWTLLNDPDSSEWSRELQKAKQSENLEKARESTRGVVDGKGSERFLTIVNKLMKSR